VSARATSGDGAPVKAVLMAAGLGTRLRPLTDRVPKCLVPVAGRPLLDHWFDLLAEAGVRDVLINTHHLPEQVRAYIAARNATGAWRVVESHEPKLLGSGGTVHATRAWADGASTVLVVYSDNLSDIDVASFLRFHRAHGDPLTMMLFRAERPERCGIAQLDPEGRIVSFVEKPKAPVGNLANAGVYAVTPDGYREMADADGFDLGFDVLPRFAGRMRGFVWEGYHRDIGDAESLTKAETAIRAGALRPRRRAGAAAAPGAAR
jgi:mannose-1-phosphate guanylyltransferase